MKKSKRAMPYWICIAIGALIFAGVASMRSIWTLSEREEILSGLCDALFVPGALLTCVGLLTFTAREGVLDIITYGFRNLLVLFAPGKHKHQHYYDYKMAKEANRGKATHAPLLVRLAIILLAGVCLIFYYYGIYYEPPSRNRGRFSLPPVLFSTHNHGIMQTAFLTH